MGQNHSASSSDLEGMKKYSGFSPKQVELIKERFELLCDEDQAVDLDTFAKLMKLSTSEAQKLFRFFDMDQSGRVDSYEFICGLTMLSSSTLIQKADALFKLYDFDNSQIITQDELMILMRTVLSSLNGISGKPAPKMQVVEEAAKKILARWDTNHDGKISLTEFRSFVTKDPDILKLLSSYELITKDDLRPDFGASEDVPDCDSDLENETGHKHKEKDDKHYQIKQGFEHNVKENDNGLFEVEDISGGDQFMAVKPWVGTVKNAVPSNYKPTKGESDAPEAILELEYVHGIRVDDTRNNLFYSPTGEAVYHTAAVGIVLNQKSNTQRFFFEHRDDIRCLAVHQNLVATGEIGPKPLIAVWDNTTMQTKATIEGVLKKGIVQICISNDGKKLAATAFDDDHCIAVYDLVEVMNPNPKKGATPPGLIASGKGPKGNVLDLKFDPTDQTLVAAGVKELNIITFAGGTVKCAPATGMGKNAQALLCIGFIDQTIVTGALDGSLLVWKGKALSNTIKAHTGKVNAMVTRKAGKGIISGGADGLVIVWDQTLKQIQKFDVNQSSIGSLNPKINAIADDPKGNLLIGTRGSEIIEVVNNTPKVLVRGHWDNELWGLATHPSKLEYVTFGMEGLLAAWDVSKRTQRASKKIEYPGKVVAFSPDAKFLALGCANGFVLIVDPKTLNTLNTLKDRTKELSELKFSPNNQFLAAGAHDTEIFIYNVSQNFKIHKKLRGHHSTITHFDFSEDSEVLQSNCTSYELLYFNTKDGKRDPSGASKNKNERWATLTLVISWFTQGIWPPCSDGTDINATDRHPKDPILATADDFSKVKLFKYPVAHEKASFVKYVGHSSHVTNCRWSGMGGNYLLTTGGNDKGVFQWKYSFDKAGHEEASAKKEMIDEEVLKEDGIHPGGGGMFEQEEIEGGDQMLAVKPFKGQVDKSWPTGYKQPKDAASAPDNNLTLKYCFGTRLFDAKDTIKYCNGSKSIVFAAAALGVVMDPTTREQNFFQMHEEDIISIAVHPSGTICATGQMAAKGKAKMIDIFVWDIATKQVLANLKGFHLRAVCLLEFSPDGTKLASIGQDDDNSLAVYDWRNNRIIATAKVDKAKVLSFSWASESEFMSCGVSHIKFYTMNGQNISAKRGSVKEDQRKDSFYCSAYSPSNQTYYSGTSLGNIISFKGAASGESIKAHEGGVFTLFASKTNLYSGGKDGNIVVWKYGGGKGGLTKEYAMSFTKESKFNPAIRSLDLKADGQTILVGTRGSEIYEVKKDSKPKLLLQGHFDNELWGCAVSPNKDLCVSSGGDNTIRLWNLEKNWMLAHQGPMEEDVRALDWSSDGSFIIAGGCKGTIYLLNPTNLEIEHKMASSFKKKDQWIEDIKISPDCTTIAFGAHGGASPLEFIGVENHKLVKKGTMNAGLTSALTHLDWSVDSASLVVNSQAYELMFINAAGKKTQAASASKDIEWATWTCILGFPVQGIFPGAEGFEVNTTCRAKNKKVLATGDDFGKVNLFKYPCTVQKANCKAFMGHSSHVTKVKFTYNDGKVVSTGGNDKCLLVWETDFAKAGGVHEEEHEEEHKGHEEHEEHEENGEHHEEEEHHANDFVQKKTKRDKYGRTKEEKVVKEEEKGAAESNGLFQLEKISGGDEFMAVKPWLGQIKAPSGYIKPQLNQNKAPKATLTLDHVHGYRAKDCRNNLKYLKNGHIVYHAAAVGIVLDSSTNPPLQRFFIGHNDDITAMDVHPNGIYVATGEVGAKPTIFIWDSNTMQATKTIKGGLQKGIAALAFSPTGEKLVGVAVDDNHYVAVYDTATGAALALEKGDTAIIADVKFLTEQNFASAGPKHFKFWTFQNKSITSKLGQFGKNNSVLTCAHVHNGKEILTGAGDGSLLVWSGNAVKNAYKLHDKTIDAVSSTSLHVITGGKDFKVNILDASNYNKLHTFELQSIVKNSLSPQVRSACFSADNKTILIGTYASELYELQSKDVKYSSATKFTVKELTKGHYTPNLQWTNEIWGLTVFQDGERYATCSDDGTLRIWSISEKKQLKVMSLNIDANGAELAPDKTTNDLQESAKARYLEVSPDNSHIVVGMKEGTVRVIDAKTLKQIKLIKDSKKWISEIKFSPDGSHVAIGSHDDAIYIYTVPEFKKTTVIKKNSSFITHIDWSEDGQALQSNSGDYNLLFWSANDGKMLSASAMKDEKWATFTCVLGFPVQGIWPPAADGTDINMVDRSHQPGPAGYSLLATADDFSKVKVFRYPCIQKGSESIVGKGHSSHVTNVRFSHKDDMIFSTGGEDNCVFQWKLEQ